MLGGDVYLLEEKMIGIKALGIGPFGSWAVIVKQNIQVDIVNTRASYNRVE
jgi:hypothetical protein